jgi:RNA recognition motif-containing protein
VRFADVESATAAISAMNGAEIHERAIQVREDTGGRGPREA